MTSSDAGRSRVALGFVLVLALALRLYGINFGLPNHEHAYSYVPDEWNVLQILKGMNPARLDFNPHYFFNPSLQFYLFGATLGVAHVLGFVNVRGSEHFYFEHPEQVARMILLGRLWSVLLSTLTVWIVYRLARRMGLDRNWSTLAALFLAIHPAHITNSHYLVVNASVTFWCTLGVLALERWIRRGGMSSLLFAGAAIGFATSTKYSGAALFPLAVLAGWFRWRKLAADSGDSALFPMRDRAPLRRAIGETVGILAIGGVAFLAGSPYVLLAFNEFRAGMHELGGYVGGTPGADHGPLGTLLKSLAIQCWSSTPPLLLAALAGAILSLRRRWPIDWLVLAWLAPLVLMVIKLGAWASDGRLMPLFPFLALLAALALAALARRSRSTAFAAVAITVATLFFVSTEYVRRFVGVMPQQAASAWARQNLRGAVSVHLAGTAIYYYPDLPRRELEQKGNQDNYPRTTEWRFIEAPTRAEARAQNPDYVFLTEYLPIKPGDVEWLDDPDYETAAFFPGKVHFFGRRVHVPIDMYDVDVWVLRRKGS